MKSLFNEKAMTLDIVDYMIDISYGEKDWGMPQGIREVLANMLDTKAKYEHYYDKEGGYCSIIDFGPGLPKKALVMGASSKAKDNSSIGQFGEGLKLTFVTSLRNKKRISISTVGYGVEIASEYSSEYDCELLRVIYTDNAREKGTEVRIECTEEEYKEAVNMFLEFKEDYQQLDKNLYLPGGYLSIMGLATEERPDLMFSYNLDDKSMTNRDRNVVKSKTLKEQMSKILVAIKNKKAITAYLDGLSDEQLAECHEYKIAFQPKHKKVWKEVIEEKYGKNAVYSSSSDGDVKAIAKGYPLIPAPTKAVKELFKYLGLKSSAMKTRNVKNEKVVLMDEKENKLTYPISKDYVKSWKISDAGREILANALDTSSDSTVEWKDGRCIISDEGLGISRKHFVIGNSEKGADSIGLFGEGFKMASLVMAREKRDMIIETVGFTYRPALERSKEFGIETFCFRYEKNKKKKGTVISFIASEEEVKEIKDMFITFRDDICPCTSIEKVDVYDSMKGKIYVNGLLTTEINTMFSYNIKDKTLVDSRDRNHVDESKLNEVLKRTLNHSSDISFIKRILTGWHTEENGQYFREYSFILEPEYSFMWYGAVNECFPNCCLSSIRHEANFKAASAGYQVLNNVPPYILRILGNSLQSADEIAENIGDDGILFDNKIVFPITNNYIKNWDETFAMREFVSNALDASHGENIRFEYEDGQVIIEDNGQGFQKKNLMIGESSSRNDKTGTKIGTFGEGLKMACLAIARQKKEVFLETVGFQVRAMMCHDNTFDADLMVFLLEENDRTVGTKITFKTSKREYEETKKMFLCFDKTRKEIEDGIYEGENAAIYLNGVKIHDIHGLYSYNLTTYGMKERLSRDRKTFISQYDEFGAVFNLIMETKNEGFIESILKKIEPDYYESNVLMGLAHLISLSAKRRWKRVAQKVWPNSCIPSLQDVEMDLVAKDNHLSVLTDLNPAQTYILRTIGFPEAKEALQEKREQEKRDQFVPLNELSATERKAWDDMCSIVMKEYGKSFPNKIKIMEELGSENETVTLGCYQRITDTVIILRALLSGERKTLLGVVAHEFMHRATGEDDRTRGFENGLTLQIGDLLNRIY